MLRFILSLSVVFFLLIGAAVAQQPSNQYVVKVSGCGADPLVTVQFSVPLVEVEKNKDRLVGIDGDTVWQCSSKICHDIQAGLAKTPEILAPVISSDSVYQIQFRINSLIAKDRETVILAVVR
ncbi:MAG: hypothetical protein JNK33_02555, partial [Candidatus Doudnabacteria bacterium]|nr:hypothetical protein [Candidatus Doudnabacteria bacterium]